MPWKRNDPDPLEIKRRKLAEQERQLAEQMARLTDEIRNPGKPAPKEERPSGPPLWRPEDDAAHRRAVEPTPARRRSLARQRRRDKILFFVFALVLLILALMVWSGYAHHAE